MSRPCPFAVVVAVLFATFPAFSTVQQPAVPIQKHDSSGAAALSDEDRKLAEIMKGTGGALDTRTIVPQLEQFVRDNPTYPRMADVYRYLLVFTSPTFSPDRAVSLADEATAKFPDDPQIRSAAISLKLRALRTQKKDEAIRELGQKLLDTETDPTVLQLAAAVDRANSVRLLEKAIAERQKNTRETATPRLEDLRWVYAQTLTQAGRKEEGLKLSLEILNQAKKDIADLEALPKGDSKRNRLTMLRRSVSSRYETFAHTLVDAGDYQRALDGVALAEQYAGDDLLEAAGEYEQLRAGIYAKMGRPDLELESYAKSFAARMDVKTRDRIRDLAAKSGKKPGDVFARAREIRDQKAVAIRGFDLKALDGPRLTLDGVREKAKVTLVNFFFPT